MAVLTVVDAHCDTIQKITDFGGELFENNYHIDLKRIIKLGVNYFQFFAAFVDRYGISGSPFERCNKLIENYYNQIGQNGEIIVHCNSYTEINKVFSQKKIVSMLSIEGGDALEGNIENLKYFYDMGVRMITLSWNYDNEICGGIGNNNCGLTNFGEKVVSLMNETGMIIDVSHISEKSFWDVAERTKHPIVASHSNARKICNHKRNLTDEQIIAIIKSGGCIGINFYTEFISENECTIKDIIRHIDHILSLGGENSIAIGSDFDGMNKLPKNLKGIQDIMKLYSELRKLGYADLLIKKIYGDNFLNVVKKIMI